MHVRLERLAVPFKGFSLEVVYLFLFAILIYITTHVKAPNMEIPAEYFQNLKIIFVEHLLFKVLFYCYWLALCFIYYIHTYRIIM